MGVGNYIRHTYGYAAWFYVTLPFEEENYDEVQFAYETLKEDVLNALTSSYYRQKPNERKWDGDSLLLAENNAVKVLIADNQCSSAIIFETQKEEGEQGFPLHARHVDLAWKRTAKFLLENGYDLSVRTSAWTSGQLTLEDLK